MKKTILTLVLITISIIAKSQMFGDKVYTYGDTIKKDPIKTDTVYVFKRTLEEMNTDVYIMRENLKRCHTQYTNGLGITVGGILVSGIGISVLIEKNNTTPVAVMCVVGGLLTIIGQIVMIDSHKYINKAGLGISNNGIVYKFK